MEQTIGRVALPHDTVPPAPDDTVPPAPDDLTGPTGIARRLWRARVAVHLLALAVVLLALMAVVGLSSSFLSDEGAGIIQARSLASGHGWIVPPPMPEVDPAGEWYPLINSEHGPNGFAPLAKHPAYSALLAVASRLGGVGVMVMLSVAGTVAAAGFAAAIARRLDPALARPTVWVVGLASPLLFDAFLVMGHTLGAALAAGAALFAIRAITERRPALAAAVVPCIAGAVLVRSEALIFACGLALVAGAVMLRGPSPRPALFVAAAAAGGAVLARAGEAVWFTHIMGGAPGAIAVPSQPGPSFLQGRFDGFYITWMLPDYHLAKPVSQLLLAVVAGLAVAALGARSAPAHRGRVLVPAGLAACCAVSALLVAPTTLVPGLLVAFPLLTAAVVAMRRVLFREVAVMLAAGTSVFFALGVIATQYPSGGTGEWGGRYFALVIPVIVPVLLLALYRQAGALERAVRTGAIGALVVCSAASSVMAVSSIRDRHQWGERFLASVEQAQLVAGPGRPVLTTWSASPRLAWPIYDRAPWLWVLTDEIPDATKALAAAGTDRFVFVTAEPGLDQPRLAGLEVLWAGAPRGLERNILVLKVPGRVG